jgi:hypothetical protein
MRGYGSIRATETTDRDRENQPRIEHGLNTDRMQAGKELVSVSYGDGGTRPEAQLLNELKATGIRVGLLINFGRTNVEFKRFVF